MTLCLSMLEQQLKASESHVQAKGEGWTVELPLRIQNGCNVREHHFARARRVKKERSKVAWALMSRWGIHFRPVLPVKVTMTRLAPRALDYVNLVAGLKGVQDEIAAWLGITDAPDDMRARWVFEQEKAKGYACRIEIEGAS